MGWNADTFDVFYGFLIQHPQRLVNVMKDFSLVAFLFYDPKATENERFHNLMVKDFQRLDEETGNRFLFVVPLGDISSADLQGPMKDIRFPSWFQEKRSSVHRSRLSQVILQVLNSDKKDRNIVICDPKNPDGNYLKFLTNEKIIREQLLFFTRFAENLEGRSLSNIFQMYPLESSDILEFTSPRMDILKSFEVEKSLRKTLEEIVSFATKDKGIHEFMEYLCTKESRGDIIKEIYLQNGSMDITIDFEKGDYEENQEIIWQIIRCLSIIGVRRTNKIEQVELLRYLTRNWDETARERLNSSLDAYGVFMDSEGGAGLVMQGLTAAFEREVNSSIAHMIRSNYSIDMPEKYWKYDQSQGRICISINDNWEVDINQQRPVNEHREKQLEDWKSITLGNLRALSQRIYNDQDIKRLFEIWTKIQGHRNPANHGLRRTWEDVKEVLLLLEEWCLDTNIQKMMEPSHQWKKVLQGTTFNEEERSKYEEKKEKRKQYWEDVNFLRKNQFSHAIESHAIEFFIKNKFKVLDAVFLWDAQNKRHIDLVYQFIVTSPKGITKYLYESNHKNSLKNIFQSHTQERLHDIFTKTTVGEWPLDCNTYDVVQIRDYYYRFIYDRLLTEPENILREFQPLQKNYKRQLCEQVIQDNITVLQENKAFLYAFIEKRSVFSPDTCTCVLNSKDFIRKIELEAWRKPSSYSFLHTHTISSDFWSDTLILWKFLYDVNIFPDTAWPYEISKESIAKNVLTFIFASTETPKKLKKLKDLFSKYEHLWEIVSPILTKIQYFRFEDHEPEVAVKLFQKFLHIGDIVFPRWDIPEDMIWMQKSLSNVHIYGEFPFFQKLKECNVQRLTVKSSLNLPPIIPGLIRLRLINIQNLEVLTTDDEQTFEKLKVEKCDLLKEIHIGSKSKLKELTIQSCPNLTKIVINVSLEKLTLKNLHRLSVTEGLTAAQERNISSCPALK